MLLIPDLQWPLGSSSVENMDSLRPWGRVFGNHWVKIVSPNLKSCTIVHGQKRMCVSNETTFITRPWVLCCFCFYQIDMKELLQCQVWKSRWKEITFFPVFHLDPQNLVFHSNEANTVVRTQAWQQFAHNWTVAKQPKKSLSLLDTAGGATLNVELARQALALQFTDYHIFYTFVFWVPASKNSSQ